VGATGGAAAGHRGVHGPPRLGAYSQGWVLWGASCWGWAPETVRGTRHGDLLALSDMLLDKARGGRA
jgi:hypothetical protein